LEQGAVQDHSSSPWVLTDSEISQVLGDSGGNYVVETAGRFKALFAGQEYDQVYFTQDVVGHFAQLAMLAYPKAAHIMVGDGLGYVLDKEYLIACATGRGWDESRRLMRHKPSAPEADKAVLIIPADQTGDCLIGKELLIVPKLLVQAVLEDFRRVTPELKTYSESIIQSSRLPRYLMILGNFADAGATSEEKELAMYLEILARCVPKGAAVFLKGHPLAVKPVAQRLLESMQSDYAATLLAPEYGFYPMELWADLVNACQVVAVAYCAISLRYLYHKPVIYALGPELIEKYLNPQTWVYCKESDVAYREQFERLEGGEGGGLMGWGRRFPHPRVGCGK
jgi:hypothetical protein